MYALLFSLVFRRMPAEAAHRAGFWLIRAAAAAPGLSWLLRRWLAPSDPVLRVRVFGRDLPGPLGLAAGFDKDALAPDAFGMLGFAFVETGTVTARPQPGNPRPRLSRLPADRALVNRMGFNNDGAAAAASRLRRRRGRGLMVGANIGKSKAVPQAGAIGDYAASARLLADAADYLVVNVSSPNTPGLRDLQAVSHLRPLLAAVRAALDEAGPRRVPLLVKIAPDLADEDIDALADLALDLGLDGIIATNTSNSREHLASDPAGGGRRRARRPVRGTAQAAFPGGAAAAACPHRGPSRAGRGGRGGDPGRRLGADPGRGHAGAGLHRLRLRRPALAAPHPRRPGPPGPGRGPELDPARRRHQPGRGPHRLALLSPAPGDRG